MHSAYMPGQGVCVFTRVRRYRLLSSHLLNRRTREPPHYHVLIGALTPRVSHYHQPAYRRALKVALTNSHLFVCSLTVPTSPGHYPFISCYNISNSEHTLTFVSCSSTPLSTQMLIMPSYSRPSSPQHQACLFDTTSPISDVREGTPVSEVSLPSPS